jgi:hypothetical protein
MTAINNPESTEQPPATRPKIIVDFSHRLSHPEVDEPFELLESVGMMADRAYGILSVLLDQVECSNTGLLSGAVMSGVLDAAVQEIKDIKAVINAFYRSEHAESAASIAKDQAQKNPEL